jgi:uncharacterized UPF0146 family protein
VSHADGTAALADALLATMASDREDRANDDEGQLLAVEIGIGRRTAVAAALVERGVAVRATDVVPRPVPAGVEFSRDDVLEPDVAIYRDADLLYALRLPPELHRPFATLAREVGARGAFTTLGGDPPTVDVSSEQLDGGETLYRLSR